MNYQVLFAAFAFILLTACAKDKGANPSRQPDLSYNPLVSPADFVDIQAWRNNYLPDVGKTYVYEGQTDEGYERVEISRTDETILIQGIPSGVFREKSWINDQLSEQSVEFVAEDQNGTLWAFGVEADNFNTSGNVINHHGSWIYGIDEAKPGIAMLFSPQPGMKYRQEYSFNNAENQAEVIEVGKTVTTALGTFTECIVILEWSELEPDELEHKIYAPAVGLIKEIKLSNGEVVELIEIQ